ncbi:hypothetical protein MCW_00265 [Cardidatus Bartonella washoeensis 085-0475]|uniref:Uncharacterized protein n=1 Tax=Cardidatus Bartonella washoeensis 085-0475 TaxID=1094564 RepID=J0QTE0_9HYPH|nr:hypothetical protein MCW_00265 [Bartonella washoeensis 085-0475]
MYKNIVITGSYTFTAKDIVVAYFLLQVFTVTKKGEWI